jgi:hypothetical protein
VSSCQLSSAKTTSTLPATWQLPPRSSAEIRTPGPHLLIRPSCQWQRHPKHLDMMLEIQASAQIITSTTSPKPKNSQTCCRQP